MRKVSISFVRVPVMSVGIDRVVLGVEFEVVDIVRVL